MSGIKKGLGGMNMGQAKSAIKRGGQPLRSRGTAVVKTNKGQSGVVRGGKK